jgi:hypothetical protein
MIRRLAAALSAAACLLAIAALLAPSAAAKPKPPSCPNCPATILVGGVTCTLSACGSDCVYTCPFPR